MSDFSEPIVLGASGLKTLRIGIGADSGIPARALRDIASRSG